MQVFQQRRRGTEQHRTAREHGRVADVLSDHRLAEAVAAHQDQVARFAQKIERQSTLDHVTFDFRRPVPVEVGHGFEAFDAGVSKPPLHAAARALIGFSAHELLDELLRRPAVFRRPCQKVVQVCGQWPAGRSAGVARRDYCSSLRSSAFCFCCGRVHRRSPDREAGLR